MLTLFARLMLTAILLAVPFWVFLIPLAVLASICIGFWRRTTIRNICLVIGILVAVVSIPFAAMQASYRMEADERLEWRFEVRVKPDRITGFRFAIAGIGDTCEYWKLKSIDPNICKQIIGRYNLTEADSVRRFPPGSVTGSPWWWPKSTYGYSVYEGEDSEGGSKEIWIPKEGSAVYLYCFLE